METSKSAKYEHSANYEQRNKRIVKSSASSPYGVSGKNYSFNNNNEDDYKSNKFQVDVRKTNDEIVPVSKDEEWTKSKKIVNHKTRQIETRIQRQIVMEDGKVIADSGPQITQRTKEDVKTEELEASNKKGGKGGDGPSAYPEGYKALPGESVVSEKIETRNTTREARQEQLQYHDESIRELTGYDIHRKALASPNELIKLDESEIDSDRPRGKLIHYAAKSKKFADREEMKEISKKQRDGTITTEKTKTHHHEEIDDDELPEENVNLSAIPEASKEITKEIQYHKDWSDSLKSTNKSKTSVEDDKRSENHSRYSSVERKSPTVDKNRSTSIDRRYAQYTRSQERELASEREDIRYAKEKSVPFVKDGIGSPRYSPDSQSKSQSPIGGVRSRLDAYDVGYSADDRYQSQLNRREEARYSNRSVSSSMRDKVFKEDASVQASFSEDSSDDEAYGRSSSRNRKNETEARSHSVKVESGSRAMSGSDIAKGTYYFGQEHRGPKKHTREMSSDRCSTERQFKSTTDHREREELRSRRAEVKQTKSSMSRSSTTERANNDSVDWFNSLDARTLMDDLERECRAELTIRDPSTSSTNHRSREDENEHGQQTRTSASGEIKGKVKHEYKSTANGQVINDTSRNEAFHQSFNSPEEREDATRSFNRLMDDTFGKESRASTSPLMYDGSIRHIPIERRESGRQTSQSRSSSAACDYDYNTSNRRSYNNSRTNSPGRLSERVRYSDESPSRSVERRGTFTKSRASPTINETSSSYKNNNSKGSNEFKPYSSEFLRRSNYSEFDERNYSANKDSYSGSFDAFRKRNY